MASKLQKWRNLSNRIDLISRRDALSTIRLLHEGPDTMEELLDRHLAKKRNHQNARKEFEAARFETDPEIVTRLLIGGSDAVSSALDKLAEKQKELIERKHVANNHEFDCLVRFIDFALNQI
ncbi:hypothetical protein Bca52824_084766 [Brassica carinata]|uniref:Uncharacterized protein n=1 Tax=Brassica carinata TaxID=52824 RepID=A0A8X7PNB7_BRACI|nr:hypothetical protein Bca52824_084766 [Brassica carinata]